MATNVRNIIVGAAQLFLSSSLSTNGSPAQAYPTAITGTGQTVSSASAYLTGTGSGNWRDVGFTSAGLELSYEPNFGEITVDQSLDAARLFKQSQKVMIKTEFAEASLENLFIVMNQAATTLNGTAVSGATTGGTAAAYAYNQTLDIVGGSLGDYPVERSLIAVGQAPRVSGGTLNSERVYYGARVMSIDTSAHALKRDAGTFFPVNFRLLPDSSSANNSYGKIIDRTW
jgi:hypothetical protein